ncbi:MAG: hypothetical protein KGI97_06330 [Alphaproteobacteria bacterium]|nr:hypothetical protein [Alphaproteobacteria bacterium]
MKVIGLVLAAGAVLFALPALAAGACYTPKQMQAEQLLRLHSELMVITVTCRQASDGASLVPSYTDFTKKNIRMLHNAEQVMIGYYKAHDRGSPVARLDRLRTLLGNEYGQKSADMSAPAFCAAYRNMVPDFDSAPVSAIRDEVRRMEAADRSYEPLCGGDAAKVAKRD